MSRSSIEFNQLLADPFGTLRRVRAEGPFADLVETGLVAVLGYEDARTLLSDRRLHANFTDFLTSFGVTSGPFYDWMAGSPLTARSRPGASSACAPSSARLPTGSSTPSRRVASASSCGTSRTSSRRSASAS